MKRKYHTHATQSLEKSFSKKIITFSVEREKCVSIRTKAKQKKRFLENLVACVAVHNLQHALVYSMGTRRRGKWKLNTINSNNNSTRNEEKMMRPRRKRSLKGYHKHKNSEKKEETCTLDTKHKKVVANERERERTEKTAEESMRIFARCVYKFQMTA